MPDSPHRPPRSLSPWSLCWRIRMLLWSATWFLLCQWTPKPLNGWRLFWLRLFGAKIEGCPFIHQRARIQIPWHLTIGDRACVGDRANLYSLGAITLGPGCIIAQEAYLCTGDHDLSAAGKPLVTAPIVIKENAFVGARAFVLKGTTVGARAVVGAGSIVTKDVSTDSRVAGNPARLIPVKESEQFNQDA